jgi:hypothetical protein
MHGCNFQIVQYSPIITGVAQAAVLQDMLNYYNLTALLQFDRKMKGLNVTGYVAQMILLLW